MGSIDDLRAIAESTAPAPATMRGYLETVQASAYALQDEDVETLKAAGHSEDEIFDQTVAAAIREGLRRLDAAERVIE